VSIISVLFALLLFQAANAGPVGVLEGRAESIAQPVFRVDVANPTKDKPQSKLWFARGSWWAWLPVRGGSSVWKRTGDGWRKQTSLDAPLQGLPGQADVWADEDTACAVLVQPDHLAVVRLEWDARSHQYRPAARPVQFTMPELAGIQGSIETATIARDGRGRWWIAYNWQRRMWVRSALDSSGGAWTEPLAVSELEASSDDLCAMAALPGGVGVIWSDQAQDAVYFRWHADTARPESWNPVEVVAKGGKTADDHINAAVASDGTLYVATKNSVDLVGHAQLVLRVRDPRGRWTNHPYAVRTERFQPSRPIALLGGNPPRLLLVHTLYLTQRSPQPKSVIAWQATSLPRINLDQPARTLIDAGTRLNDVTGSKGRLPAGQPWIVLTSDPAGNVYEARLE